MFTMRSLRYLLYLLYDIVEPAVQSEVRQKWVWQPCLLRKLFLRVNHSLISRVSHKPLAMNRSCGVHSFLFKAAHQSSEDCENFSRPVFSMRECDFETLKTLDGRLWTFVEWVHILLSWRRVAKWRNTDGVWIVLTHCWAIEHGENLKDYGCQKIGKSS